MRKRIYFGKFDRRGWPDPGELEPDFLGPPQRRWRYDGGNDNWGLRAEGVDGTEHLEAHKGRLDIDLDMLGHPALVYR